MALTLKDLIAAKQSLAAKESQPERMNVAQLKELIAQQVDIQKQGVQIIEAIKGDAVKDKSKAVEDLSTETEVQSSKALVDNTKAMYQELKTHTGLLQKTVDIQETAQQEFSDEKQIEAERDRKETNTLLEKLLKAFTEGKQGAKAGESPKFSLGGLGTALAVALGSLVGAIRGQIKAIKFFASMLPDDLLKAAKSGLDKAFKFFANIGDTVGKKVSSAMEIMGNKLKALFGLGDESSKIGKAIAWVKKVWTGFIDPIADAFRVISEISGPIGKAVSFIKDIGSKILTFFTNTAGKLGAFAGVFKAVAKIAEKIALPLTVIMAVWDTVKGFIEGFEKDGLIGGIAGAIKGLFNSLIGGLLDMVKGAVSWLLGALGFNNLEKFLDSFSFQDIFAGLVDAIFNPLDTLKSVFTLWLDTWKKILTGVFDIFNQYIIGPLMSILDPIIGMIDEYVVQPLKSVFAPVVDFFTSMKDSILGFFEGFSIPEIGFTIPVIDKKVSIGPFYPFKKEGGAAAKPAEAAPAKEAQTAKAAPAQKAAPAEGAKAAPPTTVEVKPGETQKAGAVTVVEAPKAADGSTATLAPKTYEPTKSKKPLKTVEVKKGEAAQPAAMAEVKPAEGAKKQGTAEKVSAKEETAPTARVLTGKQERELLEKDPELYDKLKNYEDDLIDAGLEKIRKDPELQAADKETRRSAFEVVKKKAATDSVAKFSKELESVGVLKPQTAAAEAPKPTEAATVYDKSAQVAPSSQDTAKAPVVVSAPTVNNTSQQTQNITMPKPTRNTDSGFNRYTQKNTAFI